MQAEQITVQLRPRNAWESISLGLLFAQRHWPSVLLPWAILLGITGTVFTLAFPDDELGTASLIVWWLKPVFDRLLLHIYSAALFGRQLSTGDALRALPRLLFNSGLLLNLTLFRFSPRRSFVLPVWQLEQLKGHARASRIRTLRYPETNYPMWLTAACANFEWIITLGLLGLLYLFIPAGVEVNFFNLFSDADSVVWVDRLGNPLYFLAIFLIEPLYVAAGFMLYINRRTHLECWDIELTFRSMAKRLRQQLQKGATALILAPLLAIALLTPNHDSLAAPRPLSEAGETIEQVLQDKAFGEEKTITMWVPREKTSSKHETSDDQWLERLRQLAHYLAETFRALLWVLVAVLVGLLLLYRKQWMSLGGKRKTETDTPAAAEPSLAEASAEAPQALPGNIARIAEQHAENGEYREALSLLYRGILQRLKDNAQGLSDGATEDEVLQLAEHNLDAAHRAYLHDIVDTWKYIAWGHRTPLRVRILELCRRWEQHFPGEEEGA